MSIFGRSLRPSPRSTLSPRQRIDRPRPACQELFIEILRAGGDAAWQLPEGTGSLGQSSHPCLGGGAYRGSRGACRGGAGRATPRRHRAGSSTSRRCSSLAASRTGEQRRAPSTAPPCARCEAPTRGQRRPCGSTCAPTSRSMRAPKGMIAVGSGRFVMGCVAIRRDRRTHFARARRPAGEAAVCGAPLSTSPTVVHCVGCSSAGGMTSRSSAAASVRRGSARRREGRGDLSREP